MPDFSSKVYSQIDGGNVQPSPDGFEEGILANRVGGAVRALMGAGQRFYDRINPTVTSTGAANVYTISHSVNPGSLVKGETFAFFAHQTNTSTATFNIAGFASRALVSFEGAALAPGAIVAGAVYSVVYDGERYRIQQFSDRARPVAESRIVAGRSGNVISFDPFWDDKDYWFIAGSRVVGQTNHTRASGKVLSISGARTVLVPPLAQSWPINAAKDYELEVDVYQATGAVMFGIWTFFDHTGAVLTTQAAGWGSDSVSGFGSSNHYFPSGVIGNQTYVNYRQTIGPSGVLKFPPNAARCAFGYIHNQNSEPTAGTIIARAWMKELTPVAQLLAAGATLTGRLAAGAGPASNLSAGDVRNFLSLKSVRYNGDAHPITLIENQFGNITFGPLTSGHAHIGTDRAAFHFSKRVEIAGRLQVGHGEGASFIEMFDGDEGTRFVHNNSGTIGFLGRDGNWKLRVYDDGRVETAQLGDLSAHIDNTARSYAAGRIARTGDTMTGNLMINRDTPTIGLHFPGVFHHEILTASDASLWVRQGGSGTPLFRVGANGAISTSQLGDIYTHIETRAAAHAQNGINAANGKFEQIRLTGFVGNGTNASSYANGYVATGADHRNGHFGALYFAQIQGFSPSRGWVAAFNG